MATDVPSSASRTVARQTNGGQMTRTTPGSSVRAAIVLASSAASSGTVCIFQLAAMITGRIRESCQRRATPIPAPGGLRTGIALPTPDPGVLVVSIVEREPFDPLERPLDG